MFFFDLLQSQWDRRILKSLNSMCNEIGLCLAKPRCQNEQDEYLAKWTELSMLDVDLTLFRPVYAPKDFLEIFSQVVSPNLAINEPLGKCKKYFIFLRSMHFPKFYFFLLRRPRK